VLLHLDDCSVSGISHGNRGTLLSEGDMSDTLNNFYSSLLGTGGLPVAGQLQLFNFAKNSRNTGLLVRLAHYPDLCEEVDGILAGVTLAKVRVAWLTRAGRSDEAVRKAINSEKRVTVLCALALEVGLPAEAVCELVDTAVRLKHAKLGYNLLVHQMLNEMLMTRVCGVLGEVGLDQLTSAQRRGLSDYLKGHEAAAVAILAKAASVSCALAVIRMCGYLDADILDRLIADVVVPAARLIRPTVDNLALQSSRMTLDLMAAIVQTQVLSTVSEARLRELLQEEGGFQDWLREWRTPSTHALSSFLEYDRQSLITEAATSCDTNRLIFIMKQARTSNDLLVEQAVISNPTLDGEDLIAVAKLAFPAVVYDAAYKAGSLERAATLMYASLTFYVAPDWPADDRSRDIMKSLFEMCCTRGLPDRWSARRLCRSGYTETPDMLALPAEVLWRKLDRWDGETEEDGARLELIQLVADRLGNDSSVWGLFETLIDGSQLSVSEAIGAAQVAVGS